MHPDTVRRYRLLKPPSVPASTRPNPACASTTSATPTPSLLIAQGVNVAFASRQLGHASVSTTLNVYTHLFDHAEHAATVIEKLEGRFGDVLQTADDQPAAGQEPTLGRIRRLSDIR